MKPTQPITSPEALSETIKRSAGRPLGTTKERLSATATIAALTDRMARMIERQVERVERELHKIDQESAETPITDPARTMARLEVSLQLAGLMKQLMQIQTLRLRVGEEDGDAEGLEGGEDIIKALLSGSKPK